MRAYFHGRDCGGSIALAMRGAQKILFGVRGAERTGDPTLEWHRLQSVPDVLAYRPPTEVGAILTQSAVAAPLCRRTPNHHDSGLD